MLVIFNCYIRLSLIIVIVLPELLVLACYISVFSTIFRDLFKIDLFKQVISNFDPNFFVVLVIVKTYNEACVQHKK